ncbi:hypothetical protein [Bradyrhizobium sp. McL0615]|uniref:hypothetical protein n=1 Tax=Bradyrhizobium sp. McL0615 TaxID=3415673 RepID=UPI003CED3DB9
MSETIDNNQPNALPPPERRRISTRALGIGGAIAILAAGAALGAGGTRLAQNWDPQRVMLLQPAAIGDMRDDTPVAVKGEVTDVFGNKFVIQDGSGRALVDTGPRGEDRRIVTKGEAVTVQGRFDGGIIRAQLIAHPDGRNEAFGHGPKGGPKEGPKDGPKGPKGPKDGPRADRDGPPPPPPRDRADRGPPPPPPPADRVGPDGDAPPPPPAR